MRVQALGLATVSRPPGAPRGEGRLHCKKKCFRFHQGVGRGGKQRNLLMSFFNPGGVAGDSDNDGSNNEENEDPDDNNVKRKQKKDSYIIQMILKNHLMFI